MKTYKVNESSLKNTIKSVINEFFDRETMDSMRKLGIDDPSEKYSVDKNELKAKINESKQKCEEFKQVCAVFGQYINGVDEDLENGVQGSDGVRMTMRYRNMFGARNLQDQYLEQELDELHEELWKLDMEMEEVIGACENVL